MGDDLHLSDEQVADFKTEVGLLNQLKHPNIVGYFGCVGPDAKVCTKCIVHCIGSVKFMFTVAFAESHVAVDGSLRSWIS